MPYQYTWVPKMKRPDSSSLISIKTWDGKSVFNTNVTVNEGTITFTVPSANRYKVSVITGPIAETASITIPSPKAQPSLNERVHNIEKALQDGGTLPGGESPTISLKPDPDNEGFFLLEIDDPNA